MTALLREAPLGQLIRWASSKRYLKYPEELDDFQLPASYQNVIRLASKEEATSPSSASSNAGADGSRRPSIDETAPVTQADDLEEKQAQIYHPEQNDPILQMSRTKSRTETRPFSQERLDIEAELALERTQTKPIVPQTTSDGNILVDWYTTDDQDNPQNWSDGKRFVVSFILCLYTWVIYSGSAIYTSSEPDIMEKFHVGPVAASLPLSLYVLAYGIGPLLWSPLSEIPAIGRSPVYIVTMALFTIISLPTALVDNFAGLLVLRFLQGFLGSPCLATGGATLQDIYSLLYLPFALAGWVAAGYCGPAVGPLVSGFAVTEKGWRWSLWEILWAAGPICILMFILFPETSTPTILLRRAQRLRKLTSEKRLHSQSEIDQKHLTATTIFVDAIIKPMEITIKDPAIAFVNLYSALIYGIYYSFFEVFPLVYPVYYGFSLGMIGVVFTCVLVACLLGVAVYYAYLYFLLVPDIKKNGLRAQESRLVPALFACFGPTISLFIFAWTARADIHWIVPTIGITLYGAAVFVVVQCIFVYVPLSYPQYAASLFAANDFFRSAFACGSILFAHPLFVNLGVAKGVTVLAGLSVMGIIGMFVLWIYGAKLRARSKFAIA